MNALLTTTLSGCIWMVMQLREALRIMSGIANEAHPSEFHSCSVFQHANRKPVKSAT